MANGRGLALAAGALLAAAPATGFAAAVPAMDERVRCQRAIERVYAQHRAGGGSATALPADAVLQRKAADALLKSAALERFWGVTLTGERLQAELDRMAAHSQSPTVLRELWAALGDDPARAAECLARPALADRLVRSYYAFDERHHGALRDRARRERAAADAIDALKAGSGAYREFEWRTGRPAAAGGPTMVDRGTFDALVEGIRQRMGGAEGAIEIGRMTGVRDEESRFSVTAVLAKGEDHFRVATVEWAKEPFDSWWARTRSTLRPATPVEGFRFTRPDMAAQTACVDDTWRPTLQLLDPRYWHSAVWTGSEMIVWGGMQSVGTVYGDGSRYDPATDTWTLLPMAGAPSRREAHAAVWTGTEMIVWGNTYDGSGALYDPASNSWRPMSTAGAPPNGAYVTAVWTGTEMIVWGGYMTNQGGRYNPATDTWTPTAPSPLAARAQHTAIWTGSRMVVWGGYNGFIGVMYGDGASYDPATNAWTPITLAGAPNKRYWHDAVWTGSEMIVWGGINYPTYDLSGGRYNPVTDSWTPTSMAGAPTLRWMHKAVWTGTEMIVQGGTPVNAVGGRYDPATDTWTATDPVNAATNGQGITAVWTGTEMIVWGGLDDDFEFANYGARYNPATDSWLRTTTMNVPTARGLHAAAWTGAEMMIWGGNQGDNAGGLYDPATDTWRTTTTVGAPYSRQNPTGIWTGQEAIFWGGGQSWVDPGTGGRYDPASDSWAAVSVVNAPNDRYGHSAVWTGTEMIVFGGIGTLNDAKRYRPTTDTWTDSTTTNAPGERDHHAAVWTGTEMIVWGGFINNGITPTGGRYNPATDTWRPTNVSDSPVTRMWPIGEWTGTHMIVWGGWNWFTTEDYNDGARYDPVADTWAPTTLNGAPSPRVAQSVWTGTRLVLWGGASDRSGGRYDPVADAWTPTSLVDAPHVRGGGRWSTVWTGTEMIIWGGIIETQQGSRYCAAPVMVPDIYVTPDPLDFGSVIVGQSQDGSITVRNEGGADLAVAAVAPPSAPFSIVSDGCTGVVLPPSASCAVAVRFAPTAVGSWSGAIVISSDDPDELQVTVELAGYGAPVPVPDITVTPAGLDFGSVIVGGFDDDLVNVINDGAAPLVIHGVTPPAAPFSVLADQCTGATIPPGSGCSIFLRFAPTAPGAYSDSLVVASNDPDEPQASSALTGTGVLLSLQPGAFGLQDGGNGVWEPGETVTLVTSWTNTGNLFAPAVSGVFAPSPGVVLTDPGAFYGDIAAGATVSCSGGGDCADARATGPRPAAHWDAALAETLTTGHENDWAVHVGASFADVPPAHLAYRFVETVLHRGVTGGCAAASYCPDQSTTREQMAVFVLVAKEGPAFVPPPCPPGAEVFSDVPASSPFCRWIEELARRGVAGGCGNGAYCPASAISREQMAVFLLRVLDPALNPPPCGVPMYGDVPAASPFCRWVEELARRGVTGGCSSAPPLFCPAAPVTRGQMAVFCTTTFGLQLYGP